MGVDNGETMADFGDDCACEPLHRGVGQAPHAQRIFRARSAPRCSRSSIRTWPSHSPPDQINPHEHVQRENQILHFYSAWLMYIGASWIKLHWLPEDCQTLKCWMQKGNDQILKYETLGPVLMNENLKK